MKVLGVVGLLLVLGGVFFIDMPRLAATSNKRKYSLIYCSVLIVCFLFGALEIFRVLPRFNGMLAEHFKNILGK